MRQVRTLRVLLGLLIAVLAATVLVLAISCAARPPHTPQNECVPDAVTRTTQIYPLRIDATTPAGLPVDTSGAVVDLADIDRKARMVAACCGVQPIAGCPAVKIAPVTHPSCVGAYELLDVPAPGYGCTAKGQTPTDACPCRWRVLVQADGSILVPPDLYNLGGALASVYCGVSDPWLTPRTAACALAGDGLVGAPLGRRAPDVGAVSQ